MPNPGSTSFLQRPSGLFVPPEIVKASYEEIVSEQQRKKKQFFSYMAGRGKTGRAFTMLGGMGVPSLSGGMDKPNTTVSFNELRTRFDGSVIDKSIIGTRQFQIKQVSRRALVPEKQTGWRVMHERYADPSFQNTPEIEARCREVERVIERGINRAFCQGGFKNFLTIMAKDELVYDRKVMVMQRDGLGRVRSYWPLDPVTVKPRVQILAPYMVEWGETDETRAAARMTGQLFVDGAKDPSGRDIDLMDAAYVQEVEGRIVAAWREDEISVDITNPTNEIDNYFYGKSVFEQSLEVSEAFASTFNYNKGWFDSKVPENVVFFGGDFDAEGFAEFEKELFAQNAPGQFPRTAFVQGDENFKIQTAQLRQSLRDMAFIQWLHFLIAFKAAFYRMDPRIINFDLGSANDQNLWKNSSREQQLTLSEEQGFHTLIYDLEDWIQRTIVESWYDDLVVRWVGLERAGEADRIDMMTKKLASYSTFNEIRAEGGTLGKLNLPDGYEEIGDLPANPFLLTAMQTIDNHKFLIQQQQQAQAAAALGQGQGDSSNPSAGQQDASQGQSQDASGQQQMGKSHSFTLTIE